MLQKQSYHTHKSAAEPPPVLRSTLSPPQPLPHPTPAIARRLKDVPREVNVALLDAINKSGEMALIHTELAGQYTLRFAVGSSSTQLRHCEQAWATISNAAGRVLEQ